MNLFIQKVKKAFTFFLLKLNNYFVDCINIFLNGKIKRMNEELFVDEYILVDFEPPIYTKTKQKTSWYNYFRRTWNDTNIVFMILLVYLYLLYKREPHSSSKF